MSANFTSIEALRASYLATCSCTRPQEVAANRSLTAKEAPMPDRVLTALQVAEIRNALFVILGNATLIEKDERTHPILASKAKLIVKTVMQIGDLLPAEKADTHAG